MDSFQLSFLLARPFLRVTVFFGLLSHALFYMVYYIHSAITYTYTYYSQMDMCILQYIYIS